ncbi:hypothetical protein N431DRAFT_471899 [Stipitochalara longipes BDJ]|nr:hypothetical protein N431DRAFT_471899 [Stipitochalara longipes BDJ]
MAATDGFSDSPQRENGENLAYFEPAGERNYVATTEAWIAEKMNCPGQANTGKRVEDQDKMLGHYTAIIWPEATRVGRGTLDAEVRRGKAVISHFHTAYPILN